MYYVELLTVRNRLGWFSAVVVLIGMIAITAVRSVPNVDAPMVGIPFNVILLGASWFSCIMATMVAGTLSRDYGHLPYMWTRPIPRERMAFQYIVVDVLAILLAFAILTAVSVLTLSAIPHLYVAADASAWQVLVRALAVPLMWYGLVEVATSWNGSRARALIGVSWAVFWILAILDGMAFPGPLGSLFVLLNILNPMAYLPQMHAPNANFQVGVLGLPPLPLSYNEQTALVYAIFIVSCTIAIYAWKRMEA